MGAPQPRLILHLDVNKTLIMVDKLSGKTTLESMLDSLLSECVWGRIREGTVANTRTVEDWVMVSTEPSSTPPAEGLVTYSEFLEDFTELPKAQVKAAKLRFTEDLPDLQRQRASLLAEMTAPDGSEHFIVPAFFHLVMELMRKQVGFALVFRTFGKDLQAFAAAWNEFCTGTHPHFSLTSPAPELMLHLPAQSASVHRTGDELACGVVLAHVCPSSRAVSLAHGPAEMREAISQLVSRGSQRSLFISDDYNYWAENNESDRSGKLLLLDSSLVDSETRHIFFDDNVERHRSHIVDVRRRAAEGGAFEPVPFAQAVAEGCLVRAEPLDIIRNKRYFIQALEARGCL